MSRNLRHWVISLFIVLAWGSGWLMLWTLSFYLTNNGQQAVLFLPHGVYLAFLILHSRRYWPALVLPPLLMMFWLHSEQLLNGYLMLATPVISLLPAIIAQNVWHRFPLYWQRLTLLLASVTAASLLNTAMLTPFMSGPIMLPGLTSFTGGVLLTPFVYLIFEFLRQQHRYQLLRLDTHNPPLRTSLIIWCSLFFIIGIGTQMVLSPEIERLLLIVVFLPNVVMAWKFGWQGGVLSGLLGSMMITIARQIGVGFSNLVELEIFLATQALLGIGLGIAISRQQHLALNLHHYRQRLEAELAARRAFSLDGLKELDALYEQLLSNLKLAMSVFFSGDVTSARRLRRSKHRFRILNRRYSHAHVDRLHQQNVQSIETSSLHLGLLGDMQRLNSLFCSVAYSVLEQPDEDEGRDEY